MSEITIKCPGCGKVLRILDRPNVNNASFDCPVCKTKHKVGDCQRVEKKVQDEETDYGNKPTGGEETEYGVASKTGGTPDSEKTMVAVKPGYLVDLAGNRYQLNLGHNVLGRKARTSEATVQIIDPTGYMSREHAIVDVKNAGGNELMHLLSNYKNQNPSFVNGQKVENGDTLVLRDGDCLKFAYTELIFKMQ